MKKYPYIGEGRRGSIVLFNDDSFGFAISHENKTVKGKYSNHWDERVFTECTREYLSNTWGVVESKEHAEFIIELAESNGFELLEVLPDFGRFFAFNSGFIAFFDLESTARFNCKKITIPLPPKAKEWPQVGDEVEYRGAKFKVLMTADKSGHIVADDNGSYINPHIEDIKKPKSKQDLLIEELQTKLCNNNYVDNFTLASDIINGMIPGLSYNSVIARAVKIVINKNLDGDV